MKRVTIGEGFKHQPSWKVYLGVPLIYIPLLFTAPFTLLGVLLVRIHLRFMGASGLRSYWDFVPAWISHRYRYDDQITYKTGAHWFAPRRYRIYWIFNCKIYCPLSVALFRYLAYLVMVVENWWCPFDHEKKGDYVEGAIDNSYWHLQPQEQELLHPDDRENPIWNQDEADTPE